MNNSDPLILIDTIKVLKENKTQTIYDSRDGIKKKTSEIDSKIDSLVSLISDDTQVLFKMEVKEELDAILLGKDSEYIYYKEKGIDKKTKIKDILAIELIRL